MPEESPWIWRPDAAAVERTNAVRFWRRLGLNSLEEFLRFSRESNDEFWRETAAECRIEWFEPFTQVRDASRGAPWTRWFVGGKLNIAHNCLDRHRESSAPAILWENEAGDTREIGFGELYALASRLAHYLHALGLGEGDRVALVMPMVPEVVAILYACFKLGLVVVPIFAAFGVGAIASRLADSGARVVFTADSLVRRGRRLPLAQRVEDARASAPCVEHIVLYEYGGRGWGSLLDGYPAEHESAPLDAEAPALLLYTSGSTGKPKGCIHTHAGALIQPAKEIWLAFDHQPADRFFWLSDIGWMMGPWAVLGNHNFGGTIVMYDGAPDFPGPDRLWRLIERQRVTTFGVSPTAIRVLMHSDSAQRYPMASLRLLGSTGEPWDETSYRWFLANVGKGRCPILNISGGTEIIGCFLLPLPVQPLKVCSLGGPAPGMVVETVDDEGRPVRGRPGHLVCQRPSPSMTRGVWGDAQRYLEAYWSRFPDWWWHGDWASVDEDGQWFLHGRSDEAMNVAGRKIGPAEVETALLEHPGAAEAAVIGVPDEVKGEAIVAFVVMKPGAAFSAAELTQCVGHSLGPAFRPEAIYAVPALPKTQSGKIVRRLIRSHFLGEPAGDSSTLADSGALEAIPRRGGAG